MIKNVVVPNSPVVFLVILEENGSQDGGQNRAKIHKNAIQNLSIFSLCFFDHVGAILEENGAKIHPKLEEKLIKT